MKGAIETMVGVVLIAFMAVLSTAYISASLNTQMRASAMEDENENLDIQVVTSAAGSKYAKVTLAYRYTIPLLNMLLEHQITGYAK